MEVKKKNQKLIILVGVLLLFVGGTFAYFISKVLNNGAGGSTSATTAVINGATVRVEGIIEFDDLDILPGHKSVSGIKVTATGNNELIPYNLIWSGTNTLTTPLNFTVYKTSEQVEVTSNCSKKTKVISGVKQLSEECTISNLEKLGTEISSGTINQNDIKVTLSKDELITATSTGDIKYYYIILEYPNLDKPQNEDLNGEINGKVTVEESNTKPDINIIAAYVIQDDGEYKQVEDIPSEGYIINTEKSTCSNDAIPKLTNEGLLMRNLTKSGTSCYLYFDKAKMARDQILANITVNESTPIFIQAATTDEGVFKAADGMYGGTSYYWRGASITNHVIFANKCWRIVRINGDGTIRIIYNGGLSGENSCSGNGINENSVVSFNQGYNGDNASSYVGWTYTLGVQRPTNNTTGTSSRAKIATENWYNQNIEDNIKYSSKVADGKFCNDRDVQTTNSWSDTGGTFAYAASSRRYGNPNLNCSNEDVYTLKAGAITMDEILYAGGKDEYTNDSYYLYNGTGYWTMTPHAWDSWARIFIVDGYGRLSAGRAYGTYTNLRPVINLKSDITFSSGDGSKDNPYIVAD